MEGIPVALDQYGVVPFTLYDKLKKSVAKDASSADVQNALRDIYGKCATFLTTVQRTPVKSLVLNKDYFVFTSGSKRSRAVNAALYDSPVDPLAMLSSLGTKGVPGMSADETNAAIYKLTISFCCTVDIQKTGDQQSPGKFFEHLVAHLVSRRLGVLPRGQLPVFSIDDTDGHTTLPTDLIFDLGKKKAKLHVPVKTSTRERVVQVWAHQRVLDGAYGTGLFLGLLVCLAETKTNSKTLEVIEICLPDQWRIYQSFIAQMRRVYYLDIPAAYAELDREFPKIRVRPFGAFFDEAEQVVDEG